MARGRTPLLSMTRTLVQFAVPVFAVLALAAPASGAVRLDRAERSAIRHINALRASYGLAPVRAARKLNRSAERHSTDMWLGSFFDHTSSDGTPFHIRVRRYVGERSVGETIAWLTQHRGVGGGRLPHVARLAAAPRDPAGAGLPPHRRRPPARPLDGRLRLQAIARNRRAEAKSTPDFASRR